MPLFSAPGLTSAQLVEAVDLAVAAYAPAARDAWNPLSAEALGFDNTIAPASGRMEDVTFRTGPQEKLDPASNTVIIDPTFGAASVFRNTDGRLAIAFRGTDDFDTDSGDYLRLVDGSYILLFRSFIETVMDYAIREGIVSKDIILVGHSLGGGAVNQLRDLTSASGLFFHDSTYITIAAPIIANNTDVVNIGFDNDRVFKIWPPLGEGRYLSTTDNLLVIEDDTSAFGGSENWGTLITPVDGRRAHDQLLYLKAVQRGTESVLNQILSADSFAAFLAETLTDSDGRNIPATETALFSNVLTKSPKDTGVAYFGNTANNTITGGPGLDFIDGGLGNDVLRGGDGPDLLVPGAERDTIFADAEDRIVGTAAELNGDEISIMGAGGAGLTFEILFPDSVARSMTSADVTIVGTSLRLDTDRNGVADIVMTLTGATPTLSPGDVTNHPGGPGGRAATVVSLFDSTLGFVVDQPLNAGLAALGEASIGRLSLGGGASLIGPTGLTDFGLSAEVRNLAARDGRLFSVIEVDAGENTIINAPPFSGRGSRLGLVEFSPTTGAAISRTYLPAEVGDVESVNALAPLPGGDFLAFGESLPGRSTDRLRTLEGGADLVFRVSPSGFTTFLTNLGDGAGTRIVSADTAPDGRVFAWFDFTLSYGGGRLLEVNPSTGSAATVWSYSGPNEITGISFDTSGALLAIGGDVNRVGALFRLTPETAGIERLRSITGFFPEEFDATGMIPVPTSLAAVFAGAPLQGTAGNERLIGGPTSDSFVGSPGNDTLDGGPGVDTVSFADFASSITIDLRITGTQTVAPGSAQRLVNIENAVGTALGDYIAGQSGGNSLTGNAGTDTLIGFAGDDILDGGEGGDFLFGGTGNDTYLVDSGLDTVDEGSLQPSLGFGGTDTIISTANFFWDVYSVGEIIRLAANAADPTGAGSTIVGGVFDNTLIGNAGTNVLFGRGGSDIYDAGDGIDFMSLSTLGVTDAAGYTANGVNTVLVRPRESGPNSWDIVFEFEPGRDKLDVSRYGLSAAATLAKFVDTGASSYAQLGDGGDVLWLVNINKAALSAGDFIV
jgi:Ca2+-binding RTX toxin-like protein